MKITKRQLKAALTAAYEAGFDGGRALQHSPTDAVKRILKHEVKHAKMRKLKNVRKHWNVNLADHEKARGKNYVAAGCGLWSMQGELGTGKSAPLVEDGYVDMPSVAPAVLELLTPPHGRFFRNGVEHTLTQEQSNEEIDAFIERKILEEQNTSSSKWVHNARKQVKLPYKPVMEIDDSWDSNTLSDLLAEYDFEGMDSAQVYASLDPTSTTSDNNESNASKLNETPTKEDV